MEWAEDETDERGAQADEQTLGLLVERGRVEAADG